MSNVIPVRLRDLGVDAAAHPRGQAHLSSTSGLVRAGGWLYVVADDEHHVGVIDARDPEQGTVRLHRILPGDLPHGMKDRKKHKPDMESLAVLPASQWWPHEALILLGSGSRPNRERGVVIALDEDGSIRGEGVVVDLAPLYKALRGEFADLNIEGAFVADGTLRLLQRGNKSEDARNAWIDYPLDAVVQWFGGKRDKPPPPSRMVPMALPEVGGVPLGLTDGAARPGGGWVFSAVAEDTDNSYADGACAGSAIGWVGVDGQLERIESIEGAPKVEGIAFAADGRLLMVTDSDDPECASMLLAAALGR